jgi:vacuolar-type H+-ATPase subunit F/Vma7
VAFYVIGDEELVIGFQFVGVSGKAVHTAEEAHEAFQAATRAGNVKVLIVTEQAASLIEHEVIDWQVKGEYPLIVEIPGIEGHRADRMSLIDSIRDAVGLHV